MILTHCNAGALATGGCGTALGVVRAARAAGKQVRVVACETRPVLQGARLTAWELARDGFDVTLITDSMVAQLMRRGGVDLVVVGADRIARSADVANKIGTYGVACLAGLHGRAVLRGGPVEHGRPRVPGRRRHPDRGAERARGALLRRASRVAPEGVRADNPAFDVTPARLIRAIFTERGEVSPPSAQTLAALAPALSGAELESSTIRPLTFRDLARR